MKSVIATLLMSIMLAMPACAQQSGNQSTQNIKKMKTLIVYYSFTGNTKRIAEKIQASTGADIARIETVQPYPADYNQTVSQGNDEVRRGFKPEIKPLGVDVASYDRIIVGTPTWWYRMAPAVLTFLSNANLKDKVVVPFMTNAGWPGTVIADMKRIATERGATVENAHEFRFSASDHNRDHMTTSEQEFTRWIESLK